MCRRNEAVLDRLSRTFSAGVIAVIFPQAFARGARCDLGWHVSAFQANANSRPLITRLSLIVALPAIPQVGLERSVDLSGLNLLDKLRLRSPSRKNVYNDQD